MLDARSTSTQVPDYLTAVENAFSTTLANQPPAYQRGSSETMSGPELLRIDELRSGFADPPRTALPLMRWWWFGPSVDRDELSRELTAMAGAGFGGVEVACVHPLGPATTDFMSDAFLAAGCRLCRSRLDPAATGVLPSATSRRRHDQGSRWRWHPAGATGVSAADRSERQAGCGHRPQHRSQRVSDRPAHHRAGRAERSSLRAQIPDAGSRQSHGVRTVPVCSAPQPSS